MNGNSFKPNHFSMTNKADSVGKGAEDGGVSALKCISAYIKWAFSQQKMIGKVILC